MKILSNRIHNNGYPTWIVPAKLDRTYEIRCVEPLLEPSNTALLDVGESGKRRLVVLDSGIPAVLCDKIKLYFSSNRVKAEYLTISGGESCKNFQALQDVIRAFSVFGLDRRREPIIVFGGGAVLDLVGFAASIYRRGVPFIRVPTTMLSFVDAGIGIKTGINFNTQKNLVGSYHPPLAVFLERNFLVSLSQREFVSGFAEILKVAVGCDVDLFDALENNVSKFQARTCSDNGLGEILFRAIDVTLNELASNIYEDNLQRALDLGHTFSQAFEMAVPPFLHGEAVALDINLSAIISMYRGMLPRKDAHRIARVSEHIGLPMTLPEIDFAAVWGSALERVCHRGGRQRMPIPLCLGKCTFINDLTPDELTRALEEFSRKPWRDSNY